MLNGDVPQARAELLRHVTEIRLIPQETNNGSDYVAVGNWNLLENSLETDRDRLLSATSESIESRVREIRSFVTCGLNDLRDLLRKDTALARTELLKHSSEITMTPYRDSERRFYVAEGKWDLLGDGWTEGASRLTGGFGWLRGFATIRIC